MVKNKQLCCILNRDLRCCECDFSLCLYHQYLPDNKGYVLGDHGSNRVGTVCPDCHYATTWIAKSLDSPLYVTNVLKSPGHIKHKCPLEAYHE